MKYATVLAGLLLGGCLVLGGGQNCTAAPIQEDALPQALEKVLQDHPELILQVLRQHSEDVLNIAQDGAEMKRARMLRQQWQSDLGERKRVSLVNRPVRGDKNAQVTIVAFSDFTCSYCFKATKTLQLLLKKYEGKVRLIFKHMPLRKDDIGWRASEYFIAAGMQSSLKAWRLHDHIFEGRDELMGEHGEAFLRKHAADVGLDMARLDADLKDKAVSKVLDEDLEDSKKLNIQGTPYFLVNNLVIRGALGPDLFEEAVRMALKHTGK